MISLAPLFASSMAMASPIPDDAPVTQQRLFLKIMVVFRLKNVEKYPQQLQIC
jgi:hypothetical protein